MNADDTMKFSVSTSPVAEDSNTGGEASRRIRSFVRREGRMTRAQRRAFAECWARFGVDAGAAMLEPEWLFGRRAPLVLEIGFGDGESLVAMAMAHPEMDYLGIEVHRPGIGHVLLRAEALELSNLGSCAPMLSRFCGSYRTKVWRAFRFFFPTHGPRHGTTSAA